MPISKTAVARNAARQLTRTYVEAVTAQYVAWIDAQADQAKAVDALLGASETSKRPEAVLVEAARLYAEAPDTPPSEGGSSAVEGVDTPSFMSAVFGGATFRADPFMHTSGTFTKQADLPRPFWDGHPLKEGLYYQDAEVMFVGVTPETPEFAFQVDLSWRNRVPMNMFGTDGPVHNQTASTVRVDATLKSLIVAKPALPAGETFPRTNIGWGWPGLKLGVHDLPPTTVNISKDSWLKVKFTQIAAPPPEGVEIYVMVRQRLMLPSA